jgi:hypothetical protein
MKPAAWCSSTAVVSSSTHCWTEEAERTRCRILDALHERLREAPAEPVSVEAIARLASFDAFDALYTGRSLPEEQVADTLIAAAERTLCRGG